MDRIFVTGGARFIGSHFIEHVIKIGYKVLNYHVLTYSANLNNLKTQIDVLGVEFVKGDIRDHTSVTDTSLRFKPNYVVNFAAESHVDISISNPKTVSDVNINGTIILLECFKHYLTTLSAKVSPKFIQISTDEVCGARGIGNAATKNSMVKPSNPYSASKASAELMAISYFKTYQVPILITRCCNNYGPRQNKEKLIPKILHNFKNRSPMPIYGDGKQIRQWLHVKDHATALLKIMKYGDIGRIYNIGGEDLIPNIKLFEIIAKIYKKIPKQDNLDASLLLQFVSDRPGHDLRSSDLE